MEVRFHRLAAREFREAQKWYESRRTGLSGDFVTEVDRALERITLHPDRWPIYRNRFRRVRLRRFPYSIFYSLEKADLTSRQESSGKEDSWKLETFQMEPCG